MFIIFSSFLLVSLVGRKKAEPQYMEKKNSTKQRIR